MLSQKVYYTITTPVTVTLFTIQPLCYNKLGKYGEVSEWFKVPLSKSGVRLSRTGSSNLPLSARRNYMQQDSIFTKIIRGEIPSYKIYEDNHTYAFLDIHPSCEGHTLVVHKNPAQFVWDLSGAEYTQLMESVQKIANHFRKVSGRQYVGISVVGTDVPHNHVHIKPFNQTTELHGSPELTEDDFKAIAEKLRLND